MMKIPISQLLLAISSKYYILYILVDKCIKDHFRSFPESDSPYNRI